MLILLMNRLQCYKCLSSVTAACQPTPTSFTDHPDMNCATTTTETTHYISSPPQTTQFLVPSTVASTLELEILSQEASSPASQSLALSTAASTSTSTSEIATSFSFQTSESPSTTSPTTPLTYSACLVNSISSNFLFIDT